MKQLESSVVVRCGGGNERGRGEGERGPGRVRTGRMFALTWSRCGREITSMLSVLADRNREAARDLKLDGSIDGSGPEVDGEYD